MAERSFHEYLIVARNSHRRGSQIFGACQVAVSIAILAEAFVSDYIFIAHGLSQRTILVHQILQSVSEINRFLRTSQSWVGQISVSFVGEVVLEARQHLLFELLRRQGVLSV